jgi:glucosylceramidase
MHRHPDRAAANHVPGVAVHWYSSTFRVYEEVFDRVNAKFPEFTIAHTEGCIDHPGNDAGPGIEKHEHDKP